MIWTLINTIQVGKIHCIHFYVKIVIELIFLTVQNHRFLSNDKDIYTDKDEIESELAEWVLVIIFLYRQVGNLLSEMSILGSKAYHFLTMFLVYHSSYRWQILKFLFYSFRLQLWNKHNYLTLTVIHTMGTWLKNV